ncbi:MAG: hypothetical protein BWZ04_00410 [Firmicutes bacterium ADurb.BinA205]|nr:MAG: hypothetical protein BWZ04_00410 [Firmicutes bacterium ADurb.BinA205]
MGMFFSYLHIKKTDSFSTDDIKAFVDLTMKDKGYISTDNSNEADVSAALYTSDDSRWITVVSDDITFEDADEAEKAAVPFSEKFNTYVIAAACIDSDYFMMGLYNTSDGTSGWVNVGDFEGLPYSRENDLEPWKSILTDHERFTELINGDHVFAEEAMFGSAELIGMDSDQCCLGIRMLDIADKSRLTVMHYKKEAAVQTGPPRFDIPLYTLTPCKIGIMQAVGVVNKGGSSKGISIQFHGDYVENDEITFEDVEFFYKKNGEYVSVPIKLNKFSPQDSKPIYWWYDRDFVIPPAVDPSIPFMKRSELESERKFGVRFTPCGNPRKVLDIIVVIMPIEDVDGYVSWYVYKYDKTKRNYLERVNKEVEDIYREGGMDKDVFKASYLDPDDYDLD